MGAPKRVSAYRAPKYVNPALITVCSRAFPVSLSGRRAWNELAYPKTVSTPSLAVFRRHLKDFLIKKSYPNIVIWPLSLRWHFLSLFVSEMTYYVSSGTLNSTNSTHSSGSRGSIYFPWGQFNNCDIDWLTDWNHLYLLWTQAPTAHTAGPLPVTNTNRPSPTLTLYNGTRSKLLTLDPTRPDSGKIVDPVTRRPGSFSAIYTGLLSLLCTF